MTEVYELAKLRVDDPLVPYRLWTPDWTPVRPNGLTFIDFLCGAGGSSIGLVAAGYTLLYGINHWRRAIETHAANFRKANHDCLDINGLDMRSLPKAHVLWASVICTEGSPAGGKKKKRGNTKGQDLLFPDEEQDKVDEEAWQHTRATAYDVLRAAEVWRFEAIIVENVVEFVSDWPLFWWWVDGLKRLGYQCQVASINSAHVGAEDNPHAPQWRDRVYIMFVREGLPMPDLEPRPLAHCFECGQDVESKRVWKDTAFTRKHGNIGKYGDQYVYVCPNKRPHEDAVVEPYVLPAAAAIDMDDVGPRIGDRESLGLRPLVDNTLRKIRIGLEVIAAGPTVLQVNHGGHTGRHFPANADTLSTRTAKGGDALTCPPYLVQVGGNKRGPAPVEHPMPTRMVRDTDAVVVPPVVPPFLVEKRGGGSTVRPIDHPAAAITAGGNHHWMVTPPMPPYVFKNYNTRRAEDTVVRIDGPLGSITTRDHHGLVTPHPGLRWTPGDGLVIPYRKGRAKSTRNPLHTVATKDSAGLVHPLPEVEECGYRMLTYKEHLRAQRFPGYYEVKGNGTEQTMQAGGAVSANVAQWLGERLAAVLTQHHGRRTSRSRNGRTRSGEVAA